MANFRKIECVFLVGSASVGYSRHSPNVVDTVDQRARGDSDGRQFDRHADRRRRPSHGRAAPAHCHEQGSRRGEAAGAGASATRARSGAAMISAPAPASPPVLCGVAVSASWSSSRAVEGRTWSMGVVVVASPLAHRSPPRVVHLGLPLTAPTMTATNPTSR